MNNIRGIRILWSSNNRIYHNCFKGNTIQTYVTAGYLNEWDSGYPSGGNYWSDYDGADHDNDGIGDTSYQITVNNTDNYPIAGQYFAFNPTSEHSVQTICNSSITSFHYNNSTINFEVKGDEGTTGFCRITIPTTLMNETYRIFVNGTEIPYTKLPVSNSTHSYLYFTYDHSTKQVIIIPEYSSLLTLPLFIATFLAVLGYGRKKSGMCGKIGR